MIPIRAAKMYDFIISCIHYGFYGSNRFFFLFAQAKLTHLNFDKSAIAFKKIRQKLAFAATM